MAPASAAGLLPAVAGPAAGPAAASVRRYVVQSAQAPSWSVVALPLQATWVACMKRSYPLEAQSNTKHVHEVLASTDLINTASYAQVVTINV